MKEIKQCPRVLISGGGGGGSGIDIENLIPLHQGLNLDSSQFRMGYGFAFTLKYQGNQRQTIWSKLDDVFITSNS